MTRINENFCEIGPAYGRDYKNKAAVEKAFIDEKRDFEMYSIGYPGTYCSIRDFEPGIVVNIRYSKLRKIHPVVVPIMEESK